jgi:hypothetical protein
MSFRQTANAIQHAKERTKDGQVGRHHWLDGRRVCPRPGQLHVVADRWLSRRRIRLGNVISEQR